MIGIGIERLIDSVADDRPVIVTWLHSHTLLPFERKCQVVIDEVTLVHLVTCLYEVVISVIADDKRAAVVVTRFDSHEAEVVPCRTDRPETVIAIHLVLCVHILHQFHWPSLCEFFQMKVRHEPCDRRSFCRSVIDMHHVRHADPQTSRKRIQADFVRPIRSDPSRETMCHVVRSRKADEWYMVYGWIDEKR